MMDCDLDINTKIMTIKVEHDYDCFFDNANDVKPKLKLKNYVKCENKCFDVVDKWINKAIVKVPTGNNWHNIIKREIALLKVRYPFLTEKQLKGKALVKFGIPCSMGDIIRTGEKKVTGALAQELLKIRARKPRIPAPFKTVKKPNPFVKKLESTSPPSKIEVYLLDSYSDNKPLEMSSETLSTPKRRRKIYGLRNPYYSDNNTGKENSCPSTPKKRKIFDPVTSSWIEINDDKNQQTPTKKRKVTPMRPENKKYMVSIAQAAESIYVASPCSAQPSPNSEEEWLQSSAREELLENLRKYPYGELADYDDNKYKSDVEEVSEVEIQQDKASQKSIQSREVSKIEIDISPPTTPKYVLTPPNSQSEINSPTDFEVTPPSQSIASPGYYWPAGQKYVSQSEVLPVCRSFERLSFNESFSDNPPEGLSQNECLSIAPSDVVNLVSQDSYPTPSLKRFSTNFDHDYAINDTQILTPFLNSSVNSQTASVEEFTCEQTDELVSLHSRKNLSSVEIFTPPSPSTRFALLSTPSFLKSPPENDLNDEFSDTSDLKSFKLLSDFCDEFSQGWKKVPPSRLAPASTDIREKLKTVSMREIKEQIQGVINFLDSY